MKKERGRIKISQQEFDSKILKLSEIKLENKKKRLNSLQKKSKIFKGTIGKVIWWFSLSISIFSALFIIDSFLEEEYTKFDIKSSSEDKVGIYIQGWVVKSTFNWVFLDEEKQLGIHMHKLEFESLSKNGFLELGRTPFFKIPQNFKNHYSGIVNLQVQGSIVYFLPLFLFFVCFIWLFVKPEKGFHWIAFGYFNMIVTPVFLLVLLYRVYGYLNDVGEYSVVIAELNI